MARRYLFSTFDSPSSTGQATGLHPLPKDPTRPIARRVLADGSGRHGGLPIRYDIRHDRKCGKSMEAVQAACDVQKKMRFCVIFLFRFIGS